MLALFGIVILLVCSFGCTRKNPHIFVFPKSSTDIPLQLLSLPHPRNLTVTATHNGTTLSWSPITFINQENVQFLGYAVHRCTTHSFISCVPINTNPVATTHYTDFLNKKNKSKKYFYIVKAVFLHNQQIINSAASACVCAQPQMKE